MLTLRGQLHGVRTLPPDLKNSRTSALQLMQLSLVFCFRNCFAILLFGLIQMNVHLRSHDEKMLRLYSSTQIPKTAKPCVCMCVFFLLLISLFMCVVLFEYYHNR